MGLLSKSAILAASDLPHEDVPVPAWGGSVRIRVMTGAERDEFRATLAAGAVPVGHLSAILAVLTCIDENGDRMFSLDEVESLRAKSATSLDTVANVAMRLNGLGIQAVEDAAKNSESSQSGDFGTDLLDTSAKP